MNMMRIHVKYMSEWILTVQAAYDSEGEEVGGHGGQDGKGNEERPQREQPCEV
jgi:hypothetical protein